MLLYLAVFVLILLTLFYLIGRHSSRNEPTSSAGINQKKRSSALGFPIEGTDYKIWINIIKARRPNIHEFELFGTKAAILWKKDDPTVEVVCITAFGNQKPITSKCDHYHFIIGSGWDTQKPKGCSTPIREEITNLQSTIF